MNDKLLKSAQWYARYGWYVIPLHNPLFDNTGRCVGCSCEEWKRANVSPDYVCLTPGKHPRHNAWEDVATVDTEQIGRWWKAWPMANIGIAAGKSGLVVLDADLYKESGAAFRSDTVTSLTGGGGEHAFFLHPDIPQKLGNSKQGLPHYFDVRGHGGLVVAPPSVHESGHSYEWESDYGPHETAVLPLPDEIAKPLIAAADAAVTIDESFGTVAVDLEQWAARLPALVIALLQNDRSKIDFWTVRAMVRAGMSQDEIGAVWNQYDPTGKYSEKNGQGVKYLAMTIAKAKQHIEEIRQAQFAIEERPA